MEDILKSLESVEKVAESVLNDRQEMVCLDSKRNQNREALRQVTKQSNDSQDSKMWICVGNMFIKTKKSSVKSIIDRDQLEVNQRINELRDNLKTKVNDLRLLEGEECLKGFDLKPLDRDEFKAIEKLISI